MNEGRRTIELLEHNERWYVLERIGGEYHLRKVTATTHEGVFKRKWQAIDAAQAGDAQTCGHCEGTGNDFNAGGVCGPCGGRGVR